MNSYFQYNTLDISEDDAKDNSSNDKFWEAVSIEVKINPLTNRPQAVVSVFPPDIKHLQSARHKMQLKIKGRQNFPLTRKVTVSCLRKPEEMLTTYGNHFFTIDLNDSNITQEEFEFHVNSLKKTQSEQAKLTKHRLLSQLPKSDLQPDVVKQKPDEVTNQSVISTQDKLWESVSIEVIVNPNTNKLCAIVSVNPPDLNLLEKISDRMKQKIKHRLDSLLKGKVNYAHSKQNELYAAHGNYFFFIELKDNSLTREQFEAEVNLLKTQQQQPKSHKWKKRKLPSKLIQSETNNRATPNESQQQSHISPTTKELISNFINTSGTKRRNIGAHQALPEKATSNEKGLDSTSQCQQTDLEDVLPSEYVNLPQFSIFHQLPEHETDYSQSKLEDLDMLDDFNLSNEIIF